MTVPVSMTRVLYLRRCIFFTALVVVGLAASCTANEWVHVKRVVDGDTIVLQDGRHVRYIGLDTPESDHKRGRAAPMGAEAMAFNRQLVEGRRVRLVVDLEKIDRYGRTLAHVYRSDGLFVNAEIVKYGFAWVLYRFPNISQNRTLIAAQREAMTHGRGIWRSVDQNETHPDAYLGNRQSRRFHASGCPMAKKMSSKNREWLPGRWAAFWSGYAPARECIQFPLP